MIQKKSGLTLLFLIGILILSGCKKEAFLEFVDDRDGQMYHAILIGEQWWMAENLAYMPYVSPVDSESGIWVYGYNGQSANWASDLKHYKTYGCLYSWSVAMDVPGEYDTTLLDSSAEYWQGICPDGWHLPSDQEWRILEDYLEMDPDFDPSDDRQISGSVGACLKSDSLWETSQPNKNRTMFNAFPAGMRYHSHHFLNLGTYGYFWTSTEAYAKSAVYRYLKDDSDGTFSGFPSKRNGLSVRCIKEADD